MRNKDILGTTQSAITRKIVNAAKNADAEGFKDGFLDLCANIHNEIMAEAAMSRSGKTPGFMAGHALRVLNAEESRFYSHLIEAMKNTKADETSNPLMALTGPEKTLPISVIDRTLEDMKQSHELLAAVDTVNATGLMKYLTNTDTGDNATWGPLNEEIIKEVASGLQEITLDQCKLSAWMPVSQDMLELGPNWIDAYVRTCLSEALAIGFESGIITGTGKNMPIGMDRQCGEGVVVTGGVYPQKELVPVTEFSPASYGDLVSRLVQSPNGKPRTVRGLILVVNPLDYYSTVMPATSIMGPDGEILDNVLPVPTKIIQSVAVAQGEAILGLGKKYFLGVGGRRGIQFSDDYKFLEDQRYYKIVANSNGRPKDNNAFMRLDISNLEPAYYRVKTIE